MNREKCGSNDDPFLVNCREDLVDQPKFHSIISKVDWLIMAISNSSFHDEECASLEGQDPRVLSCLANPTLIRFSFELFLFLITLALFPTDFSFHPFPRELIFCFDPSS